MSTAEQPRQAPEPVLAVRGLTVSYGRDRVLDGVDLDVPAGRLVAVLGASGSGKTTLLRALLGLVPAPGRVGVDRLCLRSDRGTLDLRGARRGEWQRVRGTDVGFVFQDASLALTPLRRVGSLLAEVCGSPRQQRPDRVGRALAEVGFAEPHTVANRRAFELSGGMAQRVGLALAVARGPQLLLADEPTTALDGPARAELLHRLRERVAAGCGLVLVTHDVSIAANADHVVVLEAGRVAEIGPPDEVLRAPAGNAARRLIDNVPWALPVRARHPRPTPTPDVRPILEVRELTHGYDRATPVLRGADLRVYPGEVVGLAGRSGAGKTTLLRCLLGLEHPDSGALRIAGQRPEGSGWRGARRIVQLIPQDPRGSLNPWRTAAQLVADPLDYHHLGTRRWRHRRAAELLDRVGLGDLGGRRPNQLSTGQCQRVAIARALAVEPELLVADEPASALDVELQASVLRLLGEVVAERCTAALVVSHDVHVLERLCDRIAVLAEGSVVEDLPVAGWRDRARHPQTRELLACYPPDPLAEPDLEQGGTRWPSTTTAGAP